ncbi:hypothetical protein [Streptomyces lushanensis]|nr:hypothetical protein [Streptomyces lushanensis]
MTVIQGAEGRVDVYGNVYGGHVHGCVCGGVHGRVRPWRPAV